MIMRVKLPIPDHGQRLNHDATKESREFLKRFTRPCSITRSHLDAEGKLRRLLTYLENEPHHKGNGKYAFVYVKLAVTSLVLHLSVSFTLLYLVSSGTLGFPTGFD